VIDILNGKAIAHQPLADVNVPIWELVEIALNEVAVIDVLALDYTPDITSIEEGLEHML
jgi:hypothetical protein